MKMPHQPDSPSKQGPVVTPEIAAEASVWIARLHGPSRTPAMERECLKWQARSAAHRLAFERCTDVWEEVKGISVADAFASASARPASSGASSGSDERDERGRKKRSPWPLLSVGAVAVLCAALAAQRWWGVDSYSTKVGEQQMVLLDDGTRVSLNTDTRVRVDLGRELRSVNVLAGEALFEVAKDTRRPFVVRVDGSEVVALGTVFSVRVSRNGTTDEALAVTLFEGQVSLRAVAGARASGLTPTEAVLMKAGDRVRLVKSALRPDSRLVPQLDRPPTEQLMAWKRSEAIFDGASLPEAVAEMNRYTRTPIVLSADPSLLKMRVSGLYRTGDSIAFARAVAALYGLQLSERDGRIELAPTPRGSPG